MSIESGHDKPRTQPSDNHFSADDIPQTFGPYTDTEKELARQRQELAQMRETETKRKKRNKIIGGSTLAGLVLAGGGLFAGSKLAGGEAEPNPDTNPNAEAPVDPGQDVPRENPVDPVVENPGTSPTDLSPPEDAPTASAETDPYYIDYETMTNEEIIEKYTLDYNFVNAQGSPWVAEQVRSFGSTTPIVDAQSVWDTAEQTELVPEDIGQTPTGYEAEDGSWVYFYDSLHTNLEVALNMISANRTVINQTDAAESRTMMDGILIDVVRGKEQAMHKETEYFDVRDQSTAKNLIEIVNEHPEGTVFTNVYVNINTDTSGGNERYGTEILFSYREPGDEDYSMGSYRDLADQPVAHYNLEEIEITKAGPEGEIVWYRDNLWNPYDPESTHAKALIPQDK